MKLSLCITTYNRVDLTLKSFAGVLNDPRISEIIIVDDCSTEKNFQQLNAKCFSEKIALYRNGENLGMSRNKAKAIAQASNEWCIIFDSDNILDRNYLNAIDGYNLNTDTIYMPSAALPHFDFTGFSGFYLDKENISSFMDYPMFRICLNTCNMIVHRDTYLRTYKHDPEMKGTDTIRHNYEHLINGGRFFIVPGMTYNHLVHLASGFREHMDYNMKMAAQLENKIRQL